MSTPWLVIKRLFQSVSTSSPYSTHSATKTIHMPSYSTRQVGAANTLEYRLYVEDADTGKVVSPFHDIPLYADKEAGIVNMLTEIPRWTNGKLEISKEELMNPIKQDVKKGALRFVKNVFPHHGYPWNYGALPQTWENPEHIDASTGMRGDNDPVDAVEIGGRITQSGEVRRVKVLGAMALLDEGETDWKIFVIDVEDPLAAKLNDAADLAVHCPGLVDATRRWFRDYKIPDGKPANQFAFEGAVRDRAFALQIINETHQAWSKLLNKETENTKGISLANRIRGSHFAVTSDQEARIPGKTEAPPAASLDHVTLDQQVFLP